MNCRILLFSGALALFGCKIIAQIVPTPTDPHELAREYAPILWPDEDEHYYPTFPFFSAIDGFDNNGNGKVDFDDPEEIAPLSSCKKLILWDTLDEWYRKQRSNKTNYIFYRVRNEVFDSGRLRDILKKDDQWWKRNQELFNQKFPNSEAGDGQREKLRTVEYYLYYLNDVGPGWHEEDIEFIFFFVPVDPTIDFNVLVAAGHSDMSPNNILTFERNKLTESATEKVKNDRPGFQHSSLSQFNYRQHILIEQGGHANAPDPRGTGIFEPGINVNWQVANIWGTRDIIAVAGTNFMNSFSTEQVHQRSPRFKIWPEHEGLKDSLTIPNQCAQSYKLVSLERVQQLFEELKSVDPHVRSDHIDWAQYSVAISKQFKDSVAVRSNLVDKLVVGLNYLIDEPISVADISDDKIQRMVYWTKSLAYRKKDDDCQDVLESDKHMPWKHPTYTDKDASHLFREYLYRPRGAGGWGIYTKIDEWPFDWALSYTVPAGAIAPIRLPGIIEYQFWYKFSGKSSDDDECCTSHVFLWQYHYGRMISPLFMVEFPPGAPFEIGAGLSFNIPKVLWLPSMNPLPKGVRKWTKLRWTPIRISVKWDTHKETENGDNRAFHLNDLRLNLQVGLMR